MLSVSLIVALLVLLLVVLVPIQSFSPKHLTRPSSRQQSFKKQGIKSKFILPPHDSHDSHILSQGVLITASVSSSSLSVVGTKTTRLQGSKLSCDNSSTNDDTIDDQNDPFTNLSIIGICGAIGTGKSHTSKLLVEKLNSLYMKDHNVDDNSDNNAIDLEQEKEGPVAFHIDSDKLSHGVYAPGSLAINQVEEQFGKDVIQDDGTVNRKALGSIVFSDEKEMAKLEQIVWPSMRKLLLDRLNEIQNLDDTSNDNNQSQPTSSSTKNLKQRQLIVVVEAAILLDADMDKNHLFDAIWAVCSSSEIRLNRLVMKRGMKEEDALERMEAQLSSRGIGNLNEELENGSVTGIIVNDGGDDNGDELLWDKLRQCFDDPKCWKEGRFPENIISMT